jgi:hypothetical protein
MNAQGRSEFGNRQEGRRLRRFHKQTFALATEKPGKRVSDGGNNSQEIGCRGSSNQWAELGFVPSLVALRANDANPRLPIDHEFLADLAALVAERVVRKEPKELVLRRP